ncbi:hypothetical protein GCM10010218_12430 [Streptomyces mashuensis]|uniref:Uncharacterized protein n=1 Tax=Streptomyces mashuensis TaxID=33904 RepID=A0A919AZA9_9ACTN|nr:hypothetical protein [Streptomyces mashuensis]GHF32878.1 hypothetical protein GCM10010218_12430 [Streptomyces mashuensis]
MPPELNLSYTTQKIPNGQRRAILAAIDTGGYLPTRTPRRVLNSLPEEWARTDPRTGLRRLTDAGWGALMTVDRFHALRRANPETGVVPGLNYAEGRGLSRDGLVVFRDRTGKSVEATDRWRTGASAYITTRGRKLVGMPLTGPAFATRLPVNSRGIWKRPGQPDTRVQINGWPMADGSVRVWPLTGAWAAKREREVPAAELRPEPRRIRGLLTPSPAGRPVRAARARLARTHSTAIRSRHPYLRTMALRGELRHSAQEAAIRDFGVGDATARRSGAYGRPVPRPPVDRSALPREKRTGTARQIGRPGRP